MGSTGQKFSYEELASRSRPFIALIDPDDSRFISPVHIIEEMIRYLEETKQDKPRDEASLLG
ncbi:MAG: hypothetical protein RMI79_00645 [Nitrososphaerota archaeon]|nr:hypothetical protein [Nitrososphaerota archaeon]